MNGRATRGLNFFNLPLGRNLKDLTEILHSDAKKLVGEGWKIKNCMYTFEMEREGETVGGVRCS